MDILIDYNTVSRKPQLITEHLQEIRQIFSVEDKAQAFIRRRLGRNIPVRKYAITNKGFIEPFFVQTVIETIKIKYPSSKIVVSDKIKDLLLDKNLVSEPIKLKFEPRDYQYESSTKALKTGNGIIVLPTSAGKTLTIALIAETLRRHLNFKVLILVPNIQLVQQTYQDFLDYGIEKDLISKWTGDYSYEDTPIVIANNQILLSKKQDTNVLLNFNCLIVDECHKLSSAEKITKLVKQINCKHIFGFTGSLPESDFDVWTLNKIFGSVIYFKKSIELRKEQYISNVRIVTLHTEYNHIPQFTKPNMSNPTAGYEEEITWLQTNEHRNSVIAKLINKLETNSLVLVDRIAHGEFLLSYLKDKTKKEIYFVQGSVEVEERERIRQIMESKNGVVCIAISKIFSTGISIKNLHNVIFAAIGKSRIKIIQSIGRSLRLHETKEIATIFDIADTCLYYGLKHYNERENLYLSENIPIISTKIVEK